MAKKPPPPDEPPDESWMATFADAITLLMAFFVMLLTFADYDIPAFDEAAAAIAERVGGTPQETPAAMMSNEIEDAMFEMQADQAVKVERDGRGIVVDMGGSAFFQPGSAKLRQAAIPVLQKLTETINVPKFQCFNIEVLGHTDDVPIKSQMFPTNWELSAARAARIVRYFNTNNIDNNRMKASGYSDTKPKVPNLDQNGQPIMENRATNRRIEIKIERMSLEEQEKCQPKDYLKDMLEKPEQANTQPAAPTQN